MRKVIIGGLALLAICTGCKPATDSTPISSSPATLPPPEVRPVPTATVSGPVILATPIPTETSRRIPLHRSESDATESEGESLYQLVEEKEARGDVVADSLSEDEMMCVQHFDLSPTQCICWIGPLESAGVRGGGLHGMRRIVITNGSAEEAALALIKDWARDITTFSGQEPCCAAHLTVSYDGGVFKPEP
jgi:hypothetical protein